MRRDKMKKALLALSLIGFIGGIQEIHPAPPRLKHLAPWKPNGGNNTSFGSSFGSPSNNSTPRASSGSFAEWLNASSISSQSGYGSTKGRQCLPPIRQIPCDISFSSNDSQHIRPHTPSASSLVTAYVPQNSDVYEKTMDHLYANYQGGTPIMINEDIAWRIDQCTGKKISFVAPLGYNWAYTNDPYEPVTLTPDQSYNHCR